ncbi:MAG: hypothetical protein KDH96_00470 [Candidatus Riesia sp.]|nr:hypothetical protein [Candidatus Riesia sp.]
MVPSIVSSLMSLSSDQIGAKYVQYGDVDLWEGINTSSLEKITPSIGPHFGLKWIDYVKQNLLMSKLIIVPISKDGKKLYFRGQIFIAMKAGLCHDMAFKWALCKDRAKYTLLNEVVVVLQDDHLLQAYLSFDEKNYQEWLLRWQIDSVTGSITDDKKLAQLVMWFIDETVI